MQQRAGVVVLGAEIVRQHRRRVLAARGDGGESVNARNAREDAAQRFAKARTERAVAQLYDSFRRGAIEPVVEQHLQVLFWGAAVFALVGERVAGQQEDLERLAEQPGALRLARGLLQLLETERRTVLAEEPAGKLGRVDHDVAARFGPAGVHD